MRMLRAAADWLAARDPFWPAQFTVLAGILLSLDLPSRLFLYVWLLVYPVGNALINGLVTLLQVTLTSAEILHYAEPPTASIETLPGKLIITQSQAAHREIDDLLKQLAEE